jgi:hypothetical protein
MVGFHFTLKGMLKGKIILIIKADAKSGGCVELPVCEHAGKGGVEAWGLWARRQA